MKDFVECLEMSGSSLQDTGDTINNFQSPASDFKVSDPHLEPTHAHVKGPSSDFKRPKANASGEVAQGRVEFCDGDS